jgi:hypothetical protein
MKDQSYKPKEEGLRKKFIGYKLGRIGKRYIDEVNLERDRVIKMVQQVDKNIKSTETLLESFMPSVGQVMAARKRREAEKFYREKQEKEEQEKLD